jgi:hypothetical protein
MLWITIGAVAWFTVALLGSLLFGKVVRWRDMPHCPPDARELAAEWSDLAGPRL